jgi:hypothetical protein
MKHRKDVLVASAITVGVPALGYLSFGPVPALLFLTGYFGGFILWLTIRNTAPFSSIKILYWITFLLFILHRVEEKVSGFFDVLAEMTGVPKPEIVSLPIILLLITSIGAWLLGPLLASKSKPLGSYLVWTFFASMGITELAHFDFPYFAMSLMDIFRG